MATIAPYETSITAAFAAFGEWAGFLETISPAISEWIVENAKEHEGAKEQRILDRRMRRCKRICRQGGLNAGMIASQVKLDFGDFTADKQAEITQLMDFELKQ